LHEGILNPFGNSSSEQSHPIPCNKKENTKKKEETQNPK
jgi:hypothetical protein